MKKYLSLLFFICVFTLLNAQTKDTKIQLRTQSSDLVIEGKVLECQSFWNSDRTQIFTSNLIQLSKIFKGDIVGDKVEIITKGGQVDDQFSIVSHQTQFNTGMEGIFFCKKSKESSGLKKSENSGFRLYSNEQGFIQFYDNQFNPTASDKSFSYKNIQSEIYDNIVLSARQPIRNITPNIFERKQGLSEFALESLNPSVGIFFTFENVAFSLDYQKITFDVFVHASQNGVKFGKDSLKYIVLTTTPMQLAHCKFKILDCDVKAKLNFGVEYMQLFPSYYFGQLPVPFVEYSFGEDALTSAYEQFLCIEKAPIITKIYPEKLRAGVFDILTVEGKNLKMSDTENGKFYFRNSERPNESVYSEAYEIDVLSWTDTLIEIYVPSSLKGSVGSAASGKIIVENALGKQAQSDEPITIQYSIINHRDPITSEAFRISYVNADEQGGYTFKMDDELSNLNPDDCIKRALNEWACATKINWKLSPVGIFGLDIDMSDGNSTIILGDSLVDDSISAIAYAVLSGHTKLCDSGMSITGYYVDDLDIVFNKYKKHNFNCDSIGVNTIEDFYTTLVHELGHEHMLLHSVHEFNVVYNYSTLRSPSGDDIAGGLDAINWSNGWTGGGECPPKHEPKECISMIVENTDITRQINVFPNPFSTNLTIDWHDIRPEGDLAISISDIAGKIMVYEMLNDDRSTTKTLNLEYLPNGIFFLNIRGKNMNTTFKLAKQN